MAREQQLVRRYPHGATPAVFQSDSLELERKGWAIVDRHTNHGDTVVVYRRTEVAPTAAVEPSPLPTALRPLAPEVRHYTELQVIALVIGYVLAATVWFAGGAAPFTWIAALLFLLTSIFAVALDGFGVASLRGQIPWLSLDPALRRFLIVLEVLGSPVIMPYYALRVVWQYVLRQDVASPQRVAQLEARLGMMPATVGTCRKCGRPLQVGAEFCSYCGETVIEYPRICPKCSTVCLPDAQFCPKCRTRLTE
jgi:hypothetical protein